MNQLELIGESVWNTYRGMAYLIAEEKLKPGKSTPAGTAGVNIQKTRSGEEDAPGLKGTGRRVAAVGARDDLQKRLKSAQASGAIRAYQEKRAKKQGA